MDGKQGLILLELVFEPFFVLALFKFRDFLALLSPHELAPRDDNSAAPANPLALQLRADAAPLEHALVSGNRIVELEVGHLCQALDRDTGHFELGFRFAGYVEDTFIR